MEGKGLSVSATQDPNLIPQACHFILSICLIAQSTLGLGFFASTALNILNYVPVT